MKRVLILILFICLAVATFFAFKSETPKSQVFEQQVHIPPVTNLDNTKSVKSSNNIETNNTTNNILQAGSIRLISPHNNQTIISGSKITVKYELLAPVKFGTILIGTNCTHMIDDQVKVGQHSFDCTLPQLVGITKMGIQEILYSPTVEEKTANGQLSLVAGNSISVKDIEYYPEGPIVLPASSKAKEDGYIAFKILYSDGTKKEVDASDFTITFADPTIASMFGKSNKGTIYLDGKKIGSTEMTVRYKGTQKTIPIEVFPHDNTIE